MTVQTEVMRRPAAAPIPADRTLLHELFERQVARRPDHIALECDGETMTYAKLDAQANRIARMLIGRGVGPGVLVGIHFQKSCSLFAAMLGILKAGGGYVPLDSGWPRDRIDSIVKDGKIELVLTEGELGRALAKAGFVECIRFDVEKAAIAAQSAARIPARETGVTAVDVCYVIYTSGSTGRPKGVVIEHRNVINFIGSLRSIYKLGDDERVYQGFSVAFDASVEEIWAAFALGNTLVVPDQLTARSPRDVAEYINAKKLTYFSTVPSFLRMIDGDLPTVRVLILGGEPCSSDLVKRWASGRRMLNTYGPTEATIVATASECEPHRPVSIGHALPGYSVHVRNEQLAPVSKGETGELLIGGLGLARGYLNRDELNAERFIVDPFAIAKPGERLYRTHDMVRLNDAGELEFVGRNDAMVKIRGFRLELSEIEAVLEEHPTVQAAAVRVIEHGEMKELAAYVVPTAGADIDRPGISELLQRRLPEYMVPKYLDAIPELPRATSDKLDRKLLPPPRTLLTSAVREEVLPRTTTEKAIAQIIKNTFGVDTVYAKDDFFRDLRGHSLVISRAVAELRVRFPATQLSVRDLYEHRTVRQLADHLNRLGQNIAKGPSQAAAGDAPPANDAAAPLPLIARWACASVQAIVIFVYYGLIAAPLTYFIFVAVDLSTGAIDLWRAADLVTFAGFLIWPSWMLLSIGVKWVVIGRYRPGRYRLWGLYYLRWWIVTRFQPLSWSGMFVGTPLMTLYYRLMGAQVGRGSTICSAHGAAFDLVTIGADSSIGSETQLLGYRVENGWLILGNISIGDGCFVGTHCSLGLNVTMKDGAQLDDMSMLADNEVVEENQSWCGSPARSSAFQVDWVPERAAKRRFPFFYGVVHLALIYAMGYLLILSILPGLALVAYAFFAWGPNHAVAAAFIALPLSGACYLLLTVGVKKIFIGPVRVGVYHVESSAYLRLWFLNYLLENARHILLPLYATLLFPKILRLLGAKIGTGVEVSTALHIMPDLLDIGSGSFLADACVVGGFRIHRGWADVKANKIGERTFVGNSALVPPGAHLGQDTLIGVMSVPPTNLTGSKDHRRWLGSPSFELPNTAAPATFDERLTYRPSAYLVAGRVLMEMLRVLLPSLVMSANTVTFVMLVASAYRALPLGQALLASATTAVALSGMTVVYSAIVKGLLMGAFRPLVMPLWSSFVWRNEVVNGLYESTTASIITPLMGTPFISPCLRLMGCKIGCWAFIETTLFSEFDLVEIGDHAALNLGSTIQTHLFEDRVMKTDYLRIGDFCTVGNMASVLYGTTMRRGSVVGPLSLIMKGEVLPEATHWHGIPVERMGNPNDRQASHARELKKAA